MNDPLLWTLEQFSKETGWCNRSIRAWRAAGLIPNDLFIQMGRTVRVRVDLARAWISKGCPTGAMKALKVRSAVG